METDTKTPTFTKTRRRDGYDLSEVDSFVAEVAKALEERDARISELQGDLAAMRMRTPERPAPQTPQATPTDARKESSAAATRLLEIAAENADRLAAESKAEAEDVVAKAKAEGDRLVGDARAEADRLATAAQADVDRFTAESARERNSLESRLESLRQMERTHREHLRRHFSEQLAQLDDNTAPPLRAVEA